MKKATLRLFNAIQVDSKQNAKLSQVVRERTIKNGYVLHPAIQPDDKLLNIIEDMVGISGEKANAAFHKSWEVIQNSSMELLVTQQILHYFTTYDFKALGIYSEDSVYIPCEKLDLPEIKNNISLVFIKAMTADEVLEAILKLGSGIALASETLNDIMWIIKVNHYESTFVEKIENRELKALVNDFYEIVPTEPVEFLRHLISKLTDESLLIKNDYLIDKIKQADGKFLDTLLKDAPDDLASIFFRFKPLFLALKSISKNKTYFNRLRKKANKLHKPMPEDYLNSITCQIKRGILNLDVLQKKLEHASIFRKIRLAYALNHRLYSSGCTVYRVRNGRGWPAEFKWNRDWNKITIQALESVVASIVNDIQKNVDGKVFYIPENVHYALPATEKQFTGHFPTGSCVSVPKDLIAGIHWMNTDKSVDLDLSIVGESGKIGWDSDYRSENNDILFSGDMTDAPHPYGATELFYLKQDLQEAKILVVNYYNFEQSDEVETKILVAHEKTENFSLNYMVDLNNIIAFAMINIRERQNILGLIAHKDGENRLYFANINIGSSITSTRGVHSTYARKYLVESMMNTLSFRDILKRAGATVISEKTEDEFYDLSPERLNKNTIIDLIRM